MEKKYFHCDICNKDVLMMNKSHHKKTKIHELNEMRQIDNDKIQEFKQLKNDIEQKNNEAKKTMMINNEEIKNIRREKQKLSKVIEKIKKNINF